MRAPDVVVFHTAGDAARSRAIPRGHAARGGGRARRPHELVLLDRQPDVPLARPAHDVRRSSTRPARRASTAAAAPSGCARPRAAGLPAGIDVDVTGRDALDEATKHGAGGGSSVLVEALIGGLGALVVLLFVFGTLPAVLMPLAVAVAAIFNTFTLVWALTYVTSVSIIVQFLIALVGLGIAIDYALLMILRFREELRGRSDVETALVADRDPRRPLGDRLRHDRRHRPAGAGRAAAAARPLDGHRRHADPARLGARLAHAAARAARGRSARASTASA